MDCSSESKKYIYFLTFQVTRAFNIEYSNEFLKDKIVWNLNPFLQWCKANSCAYTVFLSLANVVRIYEAMAGHRKSKGLSAVYLKNKKKKKHLFLFLILLFKLAS